MKILFPVVIEILFLIFSFQATGCKTNDMKQNKADVIKNKGIGVLELEKIIHLNDVKGRIDHMDIDVKNQLLFIAALGNNSVEIVDIRKNKIVNTINSIEEPQGILYVDYNNTICAASGESGELNIYDAKTLNLTKTIHIGADTDNLRYNRETKIIYAGYGDGGIAVIDAVKKSLVSTISFPGHPEAFQFEKNGSRLFVNVPFSKSVEVINYKTDSVIGNWKINNAASNFPIALDDYNHRLFIGCRNPSCVIVFDSGLHKEASRFDIRNDIDDIFYDPDKKLIYLSCGEGYLQVYKQEDSDTYKLVQEINTSKGARTSLFVPELGRFFVAAPETPDSSAAILVFKF